MTEQMKDRAELDFKYQTLLYVLGGLKDKPKKPAILRKARTDG